MDYETGLVGLQLDASKLTLRAVLTLEKLGYSVDVKGTIVRIEDDT